MAETGLWRKPAAPSGKTANKADSTDRAEDGDAGEVRGPQAGLWRKAQSPPAPSGKAPQAASSAAQQGWKVEADLTERAEDGDAGETARSTTFAKTQLCKFFMDGACNRGAACRFAHGQQDMQDLPDLRKTGICKKWIMSRCLRSSEECIYAHGAQELRPLPPSYVGRGAAKSSSMSAASSEVREQMQLMEKKLLLQQYEIEALKQEQQIAQERYQLQALRNQELQLRGQPPYPGGPGASSFERAPMANLWSRSDAAPQYPLPPDAPSPLAPNSAQYELEMLTQQAQQQAQQLAKERYELQVLRNQELSAQLETADASGYPTSGSLWSQRPDVS
eukprot:TRINITY_DN8865_c0_g1_i1.p1 TRINITY_DN8865_c0_g1~~TRINITY_DN8865_c0_g1_i1.p1  ORF type:complete len:334 (+),score=75.96 TRINITY_DN8865_c0_g1_i1:116-1117(+)